MQYKVTGYFTGYTGRKVRKNKEENVMEKRVMKRFTMMSAITIQFGVGQAEAFILFPVAACISHIQLLRNLFGGLWNDYGGTAVVCTADLNTLYRTSEANHRRSGCGRSKIAAG